MMLPTFTPTNKVDRVLLKLHTRGPDSMAKFISALRKSSIGTDHSRVADMLEADWKQVFHSRRVLKFDDSRGMQRMFTTITHMSSVHICHCVFTALSMSTH